MQFQVPQFIEVEDKIFGPLTFRQFVYVAGGAGGSFVLYKFLPKFLSFPLIAGFMGFALALAFLKVNDRPFIVSMEAWFRYVFSNKLYIWRREEGPKKPAEIQKKARSALVVPRMSQSKLKDLAWSLDIQEKVSK